MLPPQKWYVAGWLLWVGQRLITHHRESAMVSSVWSYGALIHGQPLYSNGCRQSVAIRGLSNNSVLRQWINQSRPYEVRAHFAWSTFCAGLLFLRWWVDFLFIGRSIVTWRREMAKRGWWPRGYRCRVRDDDGGRGRIGCDDCRMRVGLPPRLFEMAFQIVPMSAWDIGRDRCIRF